MTDFTPLLQKIEEAEHPRYSLETAIAEATGWESDRPPPAYTASLDAVVALIREKLPGWWYSSGDCSVSVHASIGPDSNGRDADLLKIKQFDDGFHVDIEQPSTMALALCHVFLQALQAKAEVVL